jgi:hypothetical protein
VATRQKLKRESGRDWGSPEIMTLDISFRVTPGTRKRFRRMLPTGPVKHGEILDAILYLPGRLFRGAAAQGTAPTSAAFVIP